MKKVIYATVLLLAWVSWSYGGPNQDFLDVVGIYKRGDYKSALAGFQTLADKGVVEAQYNLGVMYLNGQGTAFDYDEAVKWFAKAAEQGDVRAQYNVAAMYINGTGIPKDYVRAYKWFRVLAAQGVQGSQVTVSELTKLMTPEQLQTGQQLYWEWAARNQECLAPECGSAIIRDVIREQSRKAATGISPPSSVIETPPTGATPGKLPAETYQTAPAGTRTSPYTAAREGKVAVSDRVSRRLSELEALYKDRLISPEEYSSIRKRILSEQQP